MIPQTISEAKLRTNHTPAARPAARTSDRAQRDCSGPKPTKVSSAWFWYSALIQAALRATRAMRASSTMPLVKLAEPSSWAPSALRVALVAGSALQRRHRQLQLKSRDSLRC